MEPLSFPKASRLLNQKDYARVFDHVQIRVPHQHLLILATMNSQNHARIGLVFSKKNLKLAVQRNRIKRRVRETFRHQRDLPCLDIIVLGRRGLTHLDNSMLNELLNDLWSRLRRKHRHYRTTIDNRRPVSNRGKG